MPSTLCSCSRDNRLLVLNGSIRSLRAAHVCFGRFSQDGTILARPTFEYVY